LGKNHGAYTRKRRLRYARSLYIGRAKSHEPECHNEGKPRTRQARRQAVRRPPIPNLPETSTSVPVSFGKVRSFLGNDVGTGPRPRSRACDSLLLVEWTAPAGVVGNGEKLVANKTQHSVQSRAWGVFRSRLHDRPVQPFQAVVRARFQVTGGEAVHAVKRAMMNAAAAARPAGSWWSVVAPAWRCAWQAGKGKSGGGVLHAILPAASKGGVCPHQAHRFVPTPRPRPPVRGLRPHPPCHPAPCASRPASPEPWPVPALRPPASGSPCGDFGTRPHPAAPARCARPHRRRQSGPLKQLQNCERRY
jgi:hypothetical protein